MEIVWLIIFIYKCGNEDGKCSCFGVLVMLDVRLYYYIVFIGLLLGLVGFLFLKLFGKFWFRERGRNVVKVNIDKEFIFVMFFDKEFSNRKYLFFNF